MTKLETLQATLQAVIGDKIKSLNVALGEVTLVVEAGDYLDTCLLLRDSPELHFEECIDLAGMDYSTYGEGAWDGKRYAAVTHLLSIRHNWRLRVRVFCSDDDFPVVASITPVWNAAGWYEREAFDLLGIVFEGHTDLRRILTDYGFIGHPFRKDFPLEGRVEVRYDPERGRVINQPVSIEPRTLVPRVIREETWLDSSKPVSKPADA